MSEGKPSETKEAKEHIEIYKEYEREQIWKHEKTKYYRLGIGIHQLEGQRIAYLGTVNYLSPDIRTNAVITSQHEHYIDYSINSGTDEIKEQFKLNYRTSFENEGLDYEWNSKNILNYLNKKYEKKTIKELFEEIKEVLNYYIYFDDSQEANFHACNIISEYFLPIWSYRIRLQFRGGSGGGKSKRMFSYTHLGFNSITASSFSEADLFRSVEGTCGSLRIDNFDFIDDDKKNWYRQFYETGFSPLGTYRRRDVSSKKFSVGKFQTFGSLMLTSIEGLDGEATENRTLIFDCLEPPSENNKEIIERKNRNLENPNTKELKRFEEIRNQLNYCFLDDWETVENLYHRIEIPEVDSRTLDIIKPVLIIAYLISPEVFESVKAYTIEKLRVQKLKELSTDDNFRFWELIETKANETSPLEFTLGEILKEYIKLYYGELDSDSINKTRYRLTMRFTSELRKNNKVKKLPIRTAGILHYSITREGLDYFFKSRGWKDLINAEKEVLEPKKEPEIEVNKVL